MESSPKTKEFLEENVFSGIARHVVGKVVSLYSAPEDLAAYLEQVNEASRNAGITLENLTKLLLTHPIKSSLLVKGFFDWTKRYHGAQQENQHKDHFLVYNQLDHQIPFRPEEDTMYVYMLTQIAIAAKELADKHPAKKMEKVLKSIIRLNQLGEDVFRTYPTVMPRFLDHNRLSLKAVQKLDRPLNCCPSLHIAYSLLMDNLSQELFTEEAFESIMYSTLRMFNSVLYVKQHSLMDVAFGMLCAKISYEENFPERKFNDLTSCFDTLQKEHPDVNYSEIEHIFRWGIFLQEKGKTLAGIIGKYLTENKYPLINPNQNGVYFDTRNGELVGFL